MDLKESNVLFFEDTHTYLLGSTDLRGITDTLIKAVFGDYTRDIPRDVLETAAARGTAIHQELARIDAGQSFPSAYEEREYVRLRDELGLIPVRSEYIVTDGKYFASPIDKVYEGDIIADIKTTADEHYPEWALQLSWYATYYKVMNKRQVQAAYVFHLPKEGHGTAHVIPIPLAPSNVIRDLVARYLHGDKVTSYAAHFQPQLPTAAARRVAQRIQRVKARYDKARQEYDNMERVLIEAFDTLGVHRYENDILTITRVAPHSYTTLDRKRLREDYPDLYEKYLQTTPRKSGVRITFKDSGIVKLM